MKKILVFLIMFALLLPSVYAVESIRGQDGKIVTIEHNVYDDLIVSGSQIIINGTIYGDLFAAGGEIIINGNIGGDAYIAGGNVIINGQIKGGLVIAAGHATITGRTDKIIAACGDLSTKGHTDKIIAAAGKVTMGPTSLVNRYAYISSGSFENQGVIKGELNLTTEELIQRGSVGSFKYQRSNIGGLGRAFFEGIRSIFTVFSILASIGMLVLGILIILLFPKPFFRVEKEVEKDPVLRTLIGFLLIIATIIALLILAVTIVGLPIVAIIGTLFLAALITSVLFVSYCTGNFITKKLNIKTSDVGIFIIGFVILTILKLIPVLGLIVNVVVVSLGFGAIFYTLKNNWNVITAKN